MNTKAFLVLAILALLLVPAMSMAVTTSDTWTETNVDITKMKVRVKGELVWEGWCEPSNLTNTTQVTYLCEGRQVAVPGLERGQNVPVTVIFESRTDLDNARVIVDISDNSGDLRYETRKFNVYAGLEYAEFLSLDIPSDWKVDGTDDFVMEVEIKADDRVSGVNEAEIDGVVQRLARQLRIMNLNLRHQVVEAGDELEASVVVKNTGEEEAEDVYLRASVADLGISQIFYLGDLAAYDNDDDEDTVSKTIVLDIPRNAQSGAYALELEAYNRNLRTWETVGFVVERYGVVSGDIEVTPQVTRNDVRAGDTATYSLIVANNDVTEQRILVSVSNTEDWATTEVLPASFDLEPGESRLVTINVNVESDAVEAEHLFSVEVEHGEDSQRFNFIANVGDGKGYFGFRDALLTIGIVLAAIIVILLIVLLTRRANEERPEESYY
ncbi:MAG: hypothetical protein JSW08_00320 [archaeon]|nr:MAG: hypothetical protein JSW08_00320 [archaeon]